MPGGEPGEEPVGHPQRRPDVRVDHVLVHDPGTCRSTRIREGRRPVAVAVQDLEPVRARGPPDRGRARVERERPVVTGIRPAVELSLAWFRGRRMQIAGSIPASISAGTPHEKRWTPGSGPRVAALVLHLKHANGAGESLAALRGRTAALRSSSHPAPRFPGRICITRRSSL